MKKSAIPGPPTVPFRRYLLLLSLLACHAVAAHAQSTTTTRTTDGKTPLEIAPGAPAGSYPLSNFDHINLYNQSLGFRLPLVRVGGRGSAGYTITLPIERKWRVDHRVYDPSIGCGTCEQFIPEHHYRPNSNWYTALKPGFSPGVMVVRPAGMDPFDSQSCGQVYRKTLTRLTFVAPDGTEYEFRDTRFGGEPQPQPASCLVGANRGREFVTADGSAATFIADADVKDRTNTPPDPEGVVFPVSGDMFLRDGTRYRIRDNRVEWIRDRNGNVVRFLYSVEAPGQPGVYVQKAVDPLGREVVINPATNEITYGGFGGVARTMRIVYAGLHDRLRPANAQHAAETPKTYGQLFPSIPVNGQEDADFMGSLFDDVVVSEVVLPDGRKYEFYYNSYGELARVVLPTGGAFEYDYQQDPGVINMGGDPGGAERYEIFRRVVRRRVYDTGGRLEGATSFGGCESPSPGPGDSCVQVDNLDPNPGSEAAACAQPLDGTGYRLVSRSKHYFHGVPGPGLFTQPTHYARWDEGRECRTETFACDGTTLLRGVEQSWRQRAPVGWWLNYNQHERGPEPAHDPRMVETLTRLADTDQVSKQTSINPADANHVGFDQYNNPTDLWEYDFGAPGTGAPGAFLRRTHTDYVMATEYVGADRDSPQLGAHLRGLTLRQWVSSDAAGASRVSLAAYEYDNYATDARHAALLPRGGITNLCLKPGAGGGCEQPSDTAFTRRGNVTGVTSYADAAAETGPVTVSSQYDVAGSVVASVDGRGNISTIGYADSFCNGPACDGDYVPNTYAFPSSTTSPVPDPTGAHGSGAAFSTSTVYDFHTGLVYSATDADNQTTRMEYNDPLDRPTAQVRPDGGRTDLYYSLPREPLHVRTLADLDQGRRVESRQYFDGLGRPTRAYSYDGSAPERAWVATRKSYDSQGRVREVSNPLFRAGHEDFNIPAGMATTTEYDSLGRVKRVTAPDGSAVTTSYDGAQVTVTDQSGKKRRSVSDALGRLVKVVEAPGAAGYGYETGYEYDALGNLRRVVQGKAGQVRQTRLFAYDSLSRLTSATNPESGTITYEYDEAGNLKKKVDARHVRMGYAYDALNRVISRSYSMEPGHEPPDGYAAAPEVGYFYDGKGMPEEGGQPLPTPANSKGRLTAVKSSVSETIYTQFDAAGRVEEHQQIVDPGTTSEQKYLMGYGYDLAGNLTSQKYPSGKVVTTEYDSAGRVAGVKDQATGNYYAGAAATDAANRVRYAAHGAVEALRLGNGLWEQTLFNSRLQPERIGLGASATDSGKLRLTYGYGATGQNNSNVRSQRIEAAGLDVTQAYEYDAVNRISLAREVNNAAPCVDQNNNATDCWRQAYTYLDSAGQNSQFGNRRIDTGTDSAGLPRTTANATPQYNPQINPATNRFDDNQGYTYDAAGNLRQDPAHSYAYDAENKLATVNGGWNGTTGASYYYDGEGRRVKKVSAWEATVFVYDALGRVVAEYSNQVKYNGTSYLTQDHLGSTRAVTGQDQAVKARHDYFPFGEEVGAGVGGRTTEQGYSQADNIRQKFTGKERDAETDLDYFLARYYSSAQGRFTSPDEFTGGPDELYYFIDDASANPTFYADPTNPQSLNKYQYAYNNPLLYVDPDGHEPEATDADPQGRAVPMPPPPVPVPGTPPMPPPPSPAELKREFDENIIFPLTELWPIRAIRDMLGTNPPPTDADVPAPAIPPSLALPLPPPQAVEARSQSSSGGPGAGRDFSEKTKAGERARAKNRCVYCGTTTTKKPGPKKSEIDHGTPKSRGGNNSPKNANNSCRTCNRQKGRKTIPEFMKWKKQQKIKG